MKWSIEAVCAWVGKQPFRSYRAAFRDNLVTGRVLLTLTEQDLTTNLGVSNALHRRTILFAIGDLTATGEDHAELIRSPSSFRDGTAVSRERASSVHNNRASGEPEMYDVFISYRRLGGADFAQVALPKLAAPLSTHSAACKVPEVP